MKQTAHTFVIVSKLGTYKVEDYGTASGELRDAHGYARTMNQDALLVLPKAEIDAEQQFKPTEAAFQRGTWFGVALGFGAAAILFGLMTWAYFANL